MKPPRITPRTWRTGTPGTPDYQETEGVTISSGPAHVFIPAEHLPYLIGRLYGHGAR